MYDYDRTKKDISDVASGLFVFFVVIVIISSCFLLSRPAPRIEYSSKADENATVMFAEMEPASTNIKPSIEDDGMPVSVENVPDKYIVKFSCEHHGGFTFESKDIYDIFKGHIGMKVQISYIDKYEITGDKNNPTKTFINTVHEFLELPQIQEIKKEGTK